MGDKKSEVQPGSEPADSHKLRAGAVVVAGLVGVAATIAAVPGSAPVWPWVQPALWVTFGLCLVVAALGPTVASHFSAVVLRRTVLGLAAVAIAGIAFLVGSAVGASSTGSSTGAPEPAQWIRLDGVSWTDTSGRFEATGVVQRDRSQEVWSFSSRADGDAGVYPQGKCETVGERFECVGWAGRDEDDGQPFIVTVAIVSDQDASFIRLREGQPFENLDDLPAGDGPFSTHSLQSGRP